MSYRWLALRDEKPEGAEATAKVRQDGRPIGFLATWPEDAKRPKGGVRIDPRSIDPSGAPAAASLVLAPAGTSLDFDDPAVVGATRAALALDPAEVLSTLIVDKMRFAGALTAVRNGNLGRLANDPFARLFPQRIVEVEEGLLGRMPPPVGPGHQRYGGGNPWPWDAWSG